MPGDFLPMLRQTNVLPRNRATDRPFGMPEIDTTGPGTLMREVLPAATSMMNDDMRRKKELMQFEASLQRKQGRGMRQPQGVGGTMGAARPMNTVAGGSSGLPEMQKLWRAEEATNKARQFQGEQAGLERTGRYEQAMDVQEAQNQGWLDRTALMNRGDYERAGLEGDMRAELERDKARYAAIQDKMKHGYKLTEDERKSYHDTRGRIMENEAKPPPPENPEWGQTRLRTNLERFRLQYPTLAAGITAEEGQPIQVDWNRYNPQQQQFIREALTGQPGQAIDPNTGVPSRTDSRRKGARPLPPRQAPRQQPAQQPSRNQPGMSAGRPIPSGY